MAPPLLADALLRSAPNHAQRVALSGGGLTWRYAEWLHHAHDVARALRREGVARDEPVMVMCSNHLPDLAAFLGTWLAGAVVVPVHRTSPAGVVAAIQRRARCRVRVDGLDGADLVARLDDGAPLSSDDRRVLEGAALVIFTSGSTGAPKGVVLSHAAFLTKLQHNQRVFGLGPDTVTLLVLNDTFSFGIWVALLTVLHGGRLVMQPRFDAAALLAALAEQRVTFVGVVPTMMRATFGSLGDEALDQARVRIAEAGALRTVVIGGEPLGLALSARLRAFIAPAQLVDVYGLTETSTSDFMLAPADAAAHAGTIGRAAAGVTWRIVGDDGGACAPSVPGELQLRTPTMMSGYLGDDEQTRAAFVDGWFRTGDLAAHDADGFVTIVGRLKELIIRGGNKVTPLEVERALAGCTGVAAALATGFPDSVLGQRIHALLVAKSGCELDAAALRRELAPLLEKFKQPDVCYVGTELPTGRTGKIDRSQLPAWLASGRIERLAAWEATALPPKETPR